MRASRITSGSPPATSSAMARNSPPATSNAAMSNARRMFWPRPGLGSRACITIILRSAPRHPWPPKGLPVRAAGCAFWSYRSSSGIVLIVDKHHGSRTPSPHRVSSRRARFRRLDQAFRRDAEPIVQAPDHLECERTFVVEDFVDAIGAADHRLQILDREPALLHGKFDRLYRIGHVHRKVLALVGLDQGSEDIQALAFGRIGVGGHQGLYLLERGPVVGLCPDWFDIHRPSSFKSSARRSGHTSAWIGQGDDTHDSV